MISAQYITQKVLSETLDLYDSFVHEKIYCMICLTFTWYIHYAHYKFCVLFV